MMHTLRATYFLSTDIHHILFRVDHCSLCLNDLTVDLDFTLFNEDFASSTRGNSSSCHDLHEVVYTSLCPRNMSYVQYHTSITHFGKPLHLNWFSIRGLCCEPRPHCACPFWLCCWGSIWLSLLEVSLLQSPGLRILKAGHFASRRNPTIPMRRRLTSPKGLRKEGIPRDDSRKSRSRC